MSKKVLCYMILDIIGIAIAWEVRWFLCELVCNVQEQWLQTGFVVLINIAFFSVCMFIVFFFLLYWWSDRKWTRIKKKIKKVNAPQGSKETFLRVMTHCCRTTMI